MHRIRRACWSVQARSEEQALAVRRWLHDRYGDELHETLVAAFDRAAPGDEVVRLDRLEFAVAVRDIADVTDLLPAEIDRVLRRRLRPADRDEAEPMTALEHEERAPSQALLAYLLTGNVAWPMRPDDPATLESLARAARHDLLALGAEVARRVADPVTRRHALCRLRQLVVGERLAPTLPESGGASRAGAPPSPHDVTERTEAAATPMVERRPALPVPRLRSRRRPLIAAEEGAVGRRGSRDRRRGSGAHRSRPGRPPESPPDDSVAARAFPIEALPSETEPSPIARAFREGTPRDFPLAVAHAGLVLVHPFLPQLVQAIGLGSPRAWDPSSDATARLAALLHFLATGREVPYELELGFIKILLGLRPETALPVGAGMLEPSDRAEAEALLRAVVAHWPALKRTSIEALRASFLQRAGLVRSDENGWRLAIEPGSFDVLLRRLPWGFSVVKLPWTFMPVHCTWTTS